MWYGDVPEILSSSSLTELVEEQDRAIYDAFPLLALFEKRVYNSEEVEFEIVKHIRKLAGVHSAPSPGDRNAYKQYGKKAVRVFYMSETFDVPSEHVAALRMPGESKDASVFDQSAIARAEEYIDEETSARVAAVRRRLHNVCASLFQSATPTVTVDGASADLNYGLTMNTAGVDWGTASSDILADWEGIVYDARKQMGGVFDTLVHGAGLRKTYLITNDDIRAQFLYSPSLANENDFPVDLLLNLPSGVQTINMWDTYVDSAGATQDTWDDQYLALMQLRNPIRRRVLEMATARTLDNSLLGGLAADSELVKNPKRIEVTVSTNEIPVIRKNEAIFLIDIDT
jgi:hypothetical protein